MTYAGTGENGRTARAMRSIWSGRYTSRLRFSPILTKPTRLPRRASGKIQFSTSRSTGFSSSSGLACDALSFTTAMSFGPKTGSALASVDCINT
jgi:hypothetical protein